MSDWRLCVRGHRDARSLTSVEVARRAGISRQSLWNIETGKSHPTVPVAIRLAAAIGLPLADLLDLHEDPGHEPGEFHHYTVKCTVCGHLGAVQLSIEPQRAAEAAA